MKILVVEDEEAIADFLERGLRAEGYEVDVARDGEEGARLAAKPEVDLVVLDRMLPGVDGIEVLAKPFVSTSCSRASGHTCARPGRKRASGRRASGWTSSPAPYDGTAPRPGCRSGRPTYSPI